MATKVYLAASYARKREMRKYRDELVKMGCAVTSRWIDNADNYETSDVSYELMQSDPELCVRYANSDLSDIGVADIFIMFTGDKKSSGGRHTEFGIAMMMLGSSNLRAICIVGPRENVFQCSPYIWYYEDWSSFLKGVSVGNSILEAEKVVRDMFDIMREHGLQE